MMCVARMKKVAGTIWDVETRFDPGTDVDVHAALSKLEAVFTLVKPSSRQKSKKGAGGDGGSGDGVKKAKSVRHRVRVHG